MSDHADLPPQARLAHPTIRMGLIGPLALVHPIHVPTRASLTPAGDFLQAYDDMDVFDATASTLSTTKPAPQSRIPLPSPKRFTFSAARLYTPQPSPPHRPDPTHPRHGGGIYDMAPRPGKEPRPDPTFPRPPEPVV